ncbi:nuclear GTPase SLIP-GC isoform X2 [Larimichthys crocea]|uniref:nuclear GTPase SLIP-GC isoform X2 n=1 Tax=Larimichthys crocea TaxID=215358 RepID=UPI000F5DD14C|nr:nuclear GTPase SLIP-GC isoform X2 [Larimichthys crocea]
MWPDMDPVSNINSEKIEEALLNLQECIATAVDTRQRLETMGRTMSILATQVQLLTNNQRATTPSVARATSAVVPPPAPSVAQLTSAVLAAPARSAARSTRTVCPPPVLQECIATAVDTCQRLETMGHTISIMDTQVQLLTSKQQTTTPLAARPTSAVAAPPAPLAARPTSAVAAPPAPLAARPTPAVHAPPAHHRPPGGQRLICHRTLVCPSTSGTSVKEFQLGKRKMDLQGESSNWQSPTNRRCNDSETRPYTSETHQRSHLCPVKRNRQNLPFLVMDEFVRSKLNEWRLSEWIQRFKDEGINQESLYCLEDQDIDSLIPKLGPRAIFKRRLESLKAEQNTTNQETVDVPAQCQQEHEERAACVQDCPSTSDTSGRGEREFQSGKRRLDFQGESSNWESPTRKRRNDSETPSCTEKSILSEVKNIMNCVNDKIPDQDNKKLNSFLKTKISDLKTDKRELVGVFGKTGAGKSSLINAVTEQKKLLPSGSIAACTSVMIKVEANMQNSKYEAHIEFITKEEWKDELWSAFNLLRDNAAQENDEDEDYRDTVEKLSALYGEEWKNKSYETLMDSKYFREIPEFLQSKRKILTYESAEELSAKLVKYTRNDSQVGEEVKRWYWPLVKCVTVRVPNNDLLEHVTLVDLPGNGDRNKSRDEMWKGVVGSCSTVWIVTEINRAVSEKEPWEILKGACSLMGNGGQCQQIHFICTKSDEAGGLDVHSAGGTQAAICERNVQAKEEVRKEFNKLTNVKKHFSDDCLKVFTVSSTEFLNKKHLNPDETEIPKLQEFLQNLNDHHSETLNYVSRAYGILSLIQGARCREVGVQKTHVCKILEVKMRQELVKVTKPMEEAEEAFEKCLCDGVEKSKSSCEKALKSVLYPRGKKGGFHRTLKCVVENNGTHKSKRKQINLNVTLASCLTDSIDEEFKSTFPNERNRAPFKGAINTFSLDTEGLIQEYKDVELQLVFLKTEEEEIKTKLNKMIRERKKTIYSSLMTTIEKTMQECYEKAATFTGQDTLKNMRETIEQHVNGLKNIMFQQAKDEMLTQLRLLKEDILKTLGDTMQESIRLSLQEDGESIPDFSMELEKVKRHYNKLKGSPNAETLIGTEVIIIH